MLPDVAPAGIGAMMLVSLQLVGDPTVPLNVMVLAPCVAPKLVPPTVTTSPICPLPAMLQEVSAGGGITVNDRPLLA
jgi:hypothetical protein